MFANYLFRLIFIAADFIESGICTICDEEVLLVSLGRKVDYRSLIGTVSLFLKKTVEYI